MNRLLLLAPAAFLACEAAQVVPVSAQVGPAGGTLQLADTTTLVIPAGALSSEVTVTLSESSPAGPPGYVLQSSLFDVEPAGLPLLTPATFEAPIWGGTQGAEPVVLFVPGDAGVEGFANGGGLGTVPNQWDAVGRWQGQLTQLGDLFVASPALVAVENQPLDLSGGNLGTGLAAVDRSVYFGDASQLTRFDLDTWHAGAIAPLDGPIFALKPRGKDIYVLTAGGLVKFPGGNGPAQTLSTTFARRFAFNDAGLFWVTGPVFDGGALQAESALMSLPDDAGAPVLIHQDSAQLVDVAVDDARAFLQNQDGGLEIVWLDGGAVARSPPGATISGGLQVAAGHAFWFDNSGPGQIERLDNSFFPGTYPSVSFLWTVPKNPDQPKYKGEVLALAVNDSSLAWLAATGQGLLLCIEGLDGSDQSCMADRSVQAGFGSLAIVGHAPVFLGQSGRDGVALVVFNL